MTAILDIIQSDQALALLVTTLIFFVIIFLVAKRWIGFSVALLLLLGALAVGLFFNNQNDFQTYLNPSATSIHKDDSEEDFHKQMLHAMADLKTEVDAEKENLRRLMGQVQDVFDSVDMQKQKLQSFIDEVRQHFKSDHPEKESSNESIIHSP